MGTGGEVLGALSRSTVFSMYVAALSKTGAGRVLRSTGTCGVPLASVEDVGTLIGRCIIEVVSLSAVLLERAAAKAVDSATTITTLMPEKISSL